MSINRYLTQPITPSASASLLAAQEPTTSQRLESQKGFNQYLLGTTKASAIHTSTTGNLVKDTEGRDGWVYTNPVLGNALNVLIFDGTYENLQYGDIQSLFLECSCDKINSSKSIPQVVIYTKPQGAGDLDPTYHATITLKYNDAGKYRLGNGEEVNFCYKTSPVQYGFDLSSRLILFETISTNNDPAFSEEIAFIRIQTDTTCPANECDVRIISAGFQAQGRGSDFPKDTSRRVKFLGTDVQKVDIDMLAEDIATKTNQETIINATIRDINNTDSIGDGSSNATAVALGYDRTNGKGRSLLVGADGGLVIKAMGSEDATITGDQHQIHVDGSGNVQTNVVNTVNINAANSINSGITNDPANSLACGMKGRTDIALASSEVFVSANSDGSVNIMNDPLNFDSPTTILNQSIADGDSVNTSVVNLGTEIDRSQLGNLEFFVDNSNSVPLTIKAIVSPDDGSNYYDNVNGKLVSSSGGAIQFNQEDIITRGIKYFLLQVTNNHGGGTASTVTIKHTNYK